ncbi:MAG TPA: adenylyl-sulfate kinase [Acidobacteriaceae bacterium]|jgi:adenylylsulfate kinase
MQRTASTQGGLAVWFTGLSGAGKTALCRALEPKLSALGYAVEVLDADQIRQHLSRDLGFSKADRDENVFRIGCLARSLVLQDKIVLVAAISPYREARLQAREQIGSFLEVYVNASLETCIRRDPKGLYARALAGKIECFTGIDDPYERPLAPEVECVTDSESLAESAEKVLAAVSDAFQRGATVLGKA